MPSGLEVLVVDFAHGLRLADGRLPQLNPRYRPGIGPHTEPQTVRMVMAELERLYPDRYAGAYALEVPYPGDSSERCDLVIRPAESVRWAVEVKMMRMYRDNGATEDASLNKLLSPYPQHHSALTDLEKLVRSDLPGTRVLLVYGFDYPDYPLEPAVQAFETLAASRARFLEHARAEFSGLVHPLHERGAVLAWAVESPTVGRHPVRRE